MARKRNSPVPALFGEREIRVARYVGHHLHKIDVHVVQLVERGASLRRRLDDDHREFRFAGWLAGYDRAGRDNVRPDSLAVIDSAPPRAHAFVIAAHITHSRHAERHVQRQHVLFVPKVNVHVPQSGNDVFAAAVDDVRAFRDPRGSRVPDSDDAFTAKHDCRMRTRWRAGPINQRDVANRRGGRGGGEAKTLSEQKHARPSEIHATILSAQVLSARLRPSACSRFSRTCRTR